MMRSSVPAFSSTISSAMRRSVRSTIRASRTVDCLAGMTAEYVRSRWGMKADAAVRLRWLQGAAGGRLEDERLRNERLSRVPDPFVLTDDELGSPIHRDKESQLCSDGEREPPLRDGESPPAREEPASHEQRALDEQIIDRTPIRHEPEPRPVEGRRLAAGEDIGWPVQHADSCEDGGCHPASPTQQPEDAEQEAHPGDRQDRMGPHLIPLDREGERDPHQIWQIGGDEEEGDGKVASRPLAELSDTEVPSEHQRRLNPARPSDEIAPAWGASVILERRGTEVAAVSLNSTGREMADGRLDALRRDLETRIRPLVPELSEEEFGALIERMAQLQYKYEARRADDFFDRLKGRDQGGK